MPIRLQEEVIGLLKDTHATKILATVDENGVPYAATRQTISLGDDGNVVYLEHLESSRANRNLLRSIWFGSKVSITVTGNAGRSYVIQGIPLRAHVSGPVFQKHYVALRERLGDVELAAVWVISPEEVLSEPSSSQSPTEDTERPFFVHLDRLLKPDTEAASQ